MTLDLSRGFVKHSKVYYKMHAYEYQTESHLAQCYKYTSVHTCMLKSISHISLDIASS